MNRRQTSQPSLLTREFAAVGVSGALFMGSFGVILPVLPVYVRDELGGSNALVGLGFGSFAIASLLVRPFVGRIGDRFGRHVLLIIGALFGSASYFGLALTDSLTALLALRLLWGVAFAAHLVGTMSLAVDLAPESRRGEAAGLLLVANHVGIALGPLVGSTVLHRWSFHGVWLVCGVATLSTALTAMTVPSLRTHVAVGRSGGPRTWFHQAGVRPGVFQAVGGLGYIGFNTFVALYAKQIGLSGAAALFLVASLTLMSMRVFGRRLPDVLGPSRGAAFSLVLVGSGMLVMGSWRTPVGLFAGVIVLCAGHGLLMPTLVAASVRGVPVDERASALSTFNMFQDLSLSIGPVLLGVVASIADYGAVFLAAGAVAFSGLLMVAGFQRSLADEAVAADLIGPFVTPAEP